MSLQRVPAQIVREIVPAVDPAAPRTPRPWDWVCSALVNKDKGECAVEILDTVFVQREQIWSWFYSSSGGVIRKKTQRKLTTANVLQRFSSIATSYEQNVAGFLALCWFEDQRRLQLFTASDCQTYLASCKGNACLSAFAHPRGELDPTRYANLEHEYSLHKSGRLQCKLYRHALGNQRILSMDHQLNSTIGDMVQSLISFIEKTKKCRVVHCTAHFVMDAFGRAMLWRTDGFQTISLPSCNVISGAPAYQGPHAVTERVLARARADASKQPDEELIQAILSSPTPVSRRQTMLLQTSVSQPSLPSPTSEFNPFVDDEVFNRRGSIQSRSQLRSKSDWDEAMQFLPTSSSLSRGRKRTLSAAHLVSSQKRGCCGDHCDTDVRKWTSKRLGFKPANLAAGPIGSRDVMRKGIGVGRSSSVISATTAASAFLTAHPDNSLVDDSLNRKPMSPQRQQMEQGANDGAMGEQTPHTIPFKLIAQARAEKQLVDLFIRRYQKGEDGDYLAEMYYGDGDPLGQTFPGYYYQEVQVCANCFAFYTLVEDVRMKALRQLERRRSSTNKDQRKRGGQQAGARDLEPLHEDREDIEGDELQLLELAVAARRLYKHAWVFARTLCVPAISKKDAAELFSFVNPHPAVAMVVHALGTLLLGRDDATPSDFKRAMSQDKLLLQLQQLDVEHLSHANVEIAAAHARNPLFSPERIGTISSCAGRFCDWIRTVLQAYAWKKYPAFRDDPDTWELLAFLKPDLAASIIPRQVFLDGFFGSPSYGGSTRPSQKQLAGSDSTAKKKSTAAAIARRAIQNEQMARLAAPSGVVEATTLGGNDMAFVCADGVTKIPYAVTGHAAAGSTKCNLIVFHDFFDTMESTKVFFRPIVAKHVGARALFFNLPGQAGSQYSHEQDNPVVLNNEWYAHKVHELLQHLQSSSRFLTTGVPFHLVGFGNGANIATSFAIAYGKLNCYINDLQSLVLLNGFARVDAQLAGILHSTVNVFSCFPPARPDLPVTFFCKYLFSEAYLSKIDVNLALSIYTAVTNPITLDGRIRICQGALHHVDLTRDLPQIAVPLVLVQSVENLLVAPTSIDPFLQRRVHIAHSWSHQQQQTQSSGYVTAEPLVPTKAKRQLHQVLATPGSVFVSWLRAGHELRQEAKHYVIELLELVVCSKEANAIHRHGVTHPLPMEHVSSPAKTDKRSSGQQGQANAVSLSACKQAAATPTSKVSIPTRATAPPCFDLVDCDQKSTVIPDSPADRAGSLVGKREVSLSAVASSPNRRESSPDSKQQASIREKPPRNSTLGEAVAPRQPTWSTNSMKAIGESAAVAAAREPDLTSFGDLITPSLPPRVDKPLLPSASLDDAHRDYYNTVDSEIEAVRVRIDAEEKRLQQEAEALRERQRIATEQRMEALQREQDRRRRQWEQEDHARLAALQQQIRDEQHVRDDARKQREHEMLQADVATIASDIPSTITPPSALILPSPKKQADDLVASGLSAMKQAIRAQPELPSLFDQMEAEERATKRIGKMRVDDFNAVKKDMTQNFSHHVKEHESSLRQELLRRKYSHAVRIQKHVRRFLAVRRVATIRQEQQAARIRRFAGGEIVRIVRGFLGRRRFQHYRRKCVREAHERASALAIQRLFRGFLCRVKFRRLLRNKKAIVVQRVYRGHMDRLYCEELREALMQRQFQDRNAAKLQATWRMHVARHSFLTQRISILAANEIQRIYRGHRGRAEAKRKNAWRKAEPGPERLALGLKMIEGSKQAFERQQHEIDALHRAQESVERQVSTIHAELQDSEKELAILERELQEIDQLEADLRELTHEAEMLHNGGLEGILRSTSSSASKAVAAQPLGSGVPTLVASTAFPSYEKGIEDLFEGRSDMKKRQADAYAVEMAIQIKRAEREKKKKDLEAEFTSVFAEVQQKRQSLREMEEKLADMEATRMRKDREFARMQRNLMELLEEQKLELENLREKGIELETATATSAAAAAATAMKAKEHEKRSQAMFESTEELMKFQFMSMSLSYFSSLNMLKNLRDINADTTASAITSTAETAAAAAAAAAAANIPTMKRLQVGGSDLMLAASQLKKTELEKKRKEEEDAKQPSQQQPMPDQVQDWTVDDVGRWLDTLSLSMYKKAFQEGAVDGAFLLELRPEDMADVLGVSHKLHVRKIMVARNKLLPLSQQEQLQIDAVNHEEQARNARQGPSSSTPLDLETVFSQARNGRMKRLVESIDAGFDINAEDDKGNTLLLIACQNVNIKMVEYLVAKRASVNHKNAQGNTPLHFAMAYDTEGKLGEYLIAHGADDTIENSFGLTAYDGLQPE